MLFINPMTDEFDEWCFQSVISPLIRATQGNVVSTDPKRPDPLEATMYAVQEAIWSEVVASFFSGAKAASEGK